MFSVKSCAGRSNAINIHSELFWGRSGMAKESLSLSCTSTLGFRAAASGLLIPEMPPVEGPELALQPGLPKWWTRCWDSWALCSLRHFVACRNTGCIAVILLNCSIRAFFLLSIHTQKILLRHSSKAVFTATSVGL